MKKLSMTILVLASALSTGVLAQTTSSGTPSQPASASAMTDAEVRKVDKDAGKITLKHGELKNLEMPAMTMVFKIGDGVDAAKLKEGSDIEFVADRVNGKLTVTEVK